MQFTVIYFDILFDVQGDSVEPIAPPLDLPLPRENYNSYYFPITVTFLVPLPMSM